MAMANRYLDASGNNYAGLVRSKGTESMRLYVQSTGAHWIAIGKA